MFGSTAKKSEFIVGPRTTSMIVHQTEQLPQTPDPPEPMRRVARWLTFQELCRYLAIDASRCEALFGLGDPIKFPTAGLRPSGAGVTRVWRDLEVDKWLVRAHGFRAQLDELLPDARA